MSCATDSNATDHPYPRGGDPAFDRWLKIDSKTTNTFTVNVGVSSDTSAHTFVSAGTNSVKKALTTVTIAGASNASLNGTYGISDIYDDREFTLDLPDNSLNGQSGTGGTFTDLQQPFRTPNSLPVDNKYGDVSELLFANADMIAEYSVNKMLANNSGYTPPVGYTIADCNDDLLDIVDVLAFNIKHGGNDRMWDTANLYVGGAVQGGAITETVEAINHLKDIALQIIKSDTVTVGGHTALSQVIYSGASTANWTDAQLASEISNINTLLTILTNAISNNSTLKSVTRTQSVYKLSLIHI